MLVLDVDVSSIGVYHVDNFENKVSTKKTYFCSLFQVIKEYLHEQDHHLLLPESAYLFHTIQMEYACTTPFTISLYKELLQEKKELLVAQYACDPLYIDIVPCVGHETGEGSIKYLLGKTGKFTRTRYMYALSPEILLTLRQGYGNLLPTIECVPKNLAPIRAFSLLLQRSSFTLLTISDQQVALCQVKNGRYDQFAHAPLGLHILLEATEDQGVQKYLFREYDELQRNTVAQKLLLDSVGFYTAALADWVGGFLIEGSPLVVCCPLVAHELFIEVLQATLQMKGAFVLPFAAMPQSNGQKAQHKADFSVAAYLHL